MDRIFAELHDRVVSIFHQALLSCAEARAWFAARGIADARLLETHRVGWAAGQLADLARGDALARLRTLGLVDADGRDRFVNMIAIPAFDTEGAVAQIAFVDGDAKVAWLFPDETPVVWNAACLAQAKDVAMAPDPMAGLAAMACGRAAVVAPAGPGVPLGRAATDALLAHRPTVELLAGAEHLKPEVDQSWRSTEVAVRRGRGRAT